MLSVISSMSCSSKTSYMHGRRCTWSNEQFNSTLVRLDMVLYNLLFGETFPNAILQGLSSSVSDHCAPAPLLPFNFGP